MPEPREKTWQQLAAEHMVRRGNWDYEDWKKRQELKHDESSVLIGVGIGAVVVGIGAVVVSILWWVL